MRAAQMLNRLIWKETRESLPVLGVGAFAPAIVHLSIQASLGAHAKRPLIPEWGFAVILLVTVMGVYLWGAEKANTKRGRNDFEDVYLVLPKSVDWLTACLFPALISFGIGAWLGVAVARPAGDWRESRPNTCLER